MDERHKVHYERVPTHGPHGFAVPRDVIKILGGGDPEIGNLVLLDTFGVHPMSAPLGAINSDKLRELGDGDLKAGHRVLRKFIAKVRRSHPEGGPTKLSKTAANYRAGSADAKCSQCTMFVKPNGCTAVEGRINPGGLCDIFERG